MSNEKKQQNKLLMKVRGILLGLCLVVGIGVGVAYAADGNTENSTSVESGRLQNGSFEELSVSIGSSKYIQTEYTNVNAWKTTAVGKLIELFIENNGTYLNNPSAILKPSNESNAAELNANEESTLYQIVQTSPSSIYEWGLDHGARNYTDTMALVIGPAQYDEAGNLVEPSKPSSNGRDQLMQMVDWLIKQGKTSVKTSAGLGEQLTVYSKKFAASGTFADNAGNDAFSMTPSSLYTEEWKIWIIADSRTQTQGAENPWGQYGLNATNPSNKYYQYTIPAGQSKTLFGFVSVGCVKDASGTPNSDKTYGNFLDNIIFRIYHPLSGSATDHGSGVVVGSDGTTDGEGTGTDHTITVNDKLTTYVTDGEPLKVQAVVRKADVKAGCEFVGLYYTVQDNKGNPVTEFLQKAGNEIEYSEDLTNEQKTGKWIKSMNDAGDLIYTYYLANITSATDLHFVFIKSPTVTYDPNGGNEYITETDPIDPKNPNYDNEFPNVYSFKPETNDDTVVSFISPYVSHAAEGQNAGWKFMGWLLTGDTVKNIPSDVDKVNADKLGSLLLQAEHTIACNYSLDGASGQTAAQYFKIFNGKVSLTAEKSYKENGEVAGVTWKDNNEKRAYANVHKGLTMVAQWRWLQAFIPQVNSGKDADGKVTYTDSSIGGTVIINNFTDTTSDENYNDTYGDNGGKSYHATTDESITATATAKDGYTFEGWYDGADADAKLVTTNANYSYTETKGSVNTYYARFSRTVTQTYIRQVKDGNTWKKITDDSIGTLDHDTYTDAPGTTASSTATEGTNYKFVGWYDSEGNNVTDGTTISYTTTGDATYYARFETAYTVNFAAQTKQADGSFKTDTVGGKVSVASVKDVDGKTASSKATANAAYKFLGWYDKDGKQLSTSATYSPTITSATNGATYYARFERIYTIENKVYLSFTAESPETSIPSAFDGRDAGTKKNTDEYGLDNKYGNTIATGFKYSLDSMTNISTIQITVSVPNTSYVKVDDSKEFLGTANVTVTGNGTSILTDSAGVEHNKGSIQQISGAITLTYYWDAAGLEAGKTYGFIIDNLYAPGATATITVNGTTGTEVTNDNGVVNTASEAYRGKSHYPQ